MNVSIAFGDFFPPLSSSTPCISAACQYAIMTSVIRIEYNSCCQVKFSLKLPPCPQNDLQPLCDLCQPHYFTLWNLSDERLKRDGRTDGGPTVLTSVEKRRGWVRKFRFFTVLWSLNWRESWFPQVHGVGVTTRPLLSPSASASPLSICPFRLSHVGRFILSLLSCHLLFHRVCGLLLIIYIKASCGRQATFMLIQQLSV